MLEFPSAGVVNKSHSDAPPERAVALPTSSSAELRGSLGSQLGPADHEDGDTGAWPLSPARGSSPGQPALVPGPSVQPGLHLPFLSPFCFLHGHRCLVDPLSQDPLPREFRGHTHGTGRRGPDGLHTDPSTRPKLVTRWCGASVSPSAQGTSWEFLPCRVTVRR